MFTSTFQAVLIGCNIAATVIAILMLKTSRKDLDLRMQELNIKLEHRLTEIETDLKWMNRNNPKRKADFDNDIKFSQ